MFFFDISNHLYEIFKLRSPFFSFFNEKAVNLTAVWLQPDGKDKTILNDMKLSKIIAAHLESNKRLVIPQLGAFIVKEEGCQIIFSELLRRDDGVLRSLLMAQGMGELEAAAAIDRFVFDIRHALQHGTPFILEGMGTLYTGADNAILFKNLPDREKSNTEAMAAREEHNDTIPELTVSRSATAQPDKHVRGLRYDTPPKQRPVRYAGSRGGVRRGKRGVDKFLLLAILAAAIAVAVMIYGYVNEKRIESIKAETEEMDSQAMRDLANGGADNYRQSGDGGQL